MIGAALRARARHALLLVAVLAAGSTPTRVAAQSATEVAFNAALDRFSAGDCEGAVQRLRALTQQLGGPTPRTQSVLVRCFHQMGDAVNAKIELLRYRRLVPNGTSPAHQALLALEPELDARVAALQREHAANVARERDRAAEAAIAQAEQRRAPIRQRLEARRAAFVAREWQAAVQSASPDVLRAFAARYPDAANTREVDARVDELDWARADRENTEAGFIRYLDAHEQGRHQREASDRIDRINWDAARAKDDVPAYRAYLDRMGAGDYAAAAKARILELLEEPTWRETLAESRTRIHRYMAYRRYLDTYPRGKYATQARAEMERLLKQR